MTLSAEMETRLALVEPLAVVARADRTAMWILEAVAFVAGEPRSGAPACVSAVISAFLRSWNNSPDDERRDTLLRPLIPKLIGTNGSAALENRRATMAADWLVRVHTPAWLRLAGFTAQADALAALPEITDFARCPSLMSILDAARNDAATAWERPRRAAGMALRTAASDSAKDAAWNAAAGIAKDAARDANGDVAWNVAGAAVWAATWNVAEDALKPTVLELQQSAITLIERMIAA